eukprot:3953836-Pyramimonas_sp.AAC.1
MQKCRKKGDDDLIGNSYRAHTPCSAATITRATWRMRSEGRRQAEDATTTTTATAVASDS